MICSQCKKAEGLDLLDGLCRLCDMFLAQQPPGSQTDREFLYGHCNGNQFEKQPHVGDFYRAWAAAAGVNTTGKVYKKTLARFPGDPQAWISDRGDVRRLCEQRGDGCEGDVTVKLPDVEPPKEIALADDIVEKAVAKQIPKGERISKKERNALKEKTRERMTPFWKK